MTAVREPLQIALPQYEGPLDLLLVLVRQHQVPLEEMPLAAITRQYLTYLDEAEACDLALSADFVYMAATLIQIKSKLLLPRDPALVTSSAGADPRQELIDQLKDHELRQAVAEQLRHRLAQEASSFSRLPTEPVPSQEGVEDAPEVGPQCASLANYLQVYRDAIELAAHRTTVQIAPDTFPLSDRLSWLEGWLFAHPSGSVELAALFELQPSHPARVALFLAVLELSRQNALEITQAGAWETVWLKRGASGAGSAKNSEDSLQDLAAGELCRENAELC